MPKFIVALRRARPLAWLALLLLCLAPAPAAAAVEISFYSHDLGSRFPHAFVTLKGRLDRNGEPVDSNHGFSATAVSPAILMGRVKGKVYSESDGYIKSSDSHFTMSLSDQEYDAVRATVTRWETLDQPSYDLGKQNCVFFVADIAKALGMATDTSRFMKKPGAFMRGLVESNRAWLVGRKAVFAKVPAKT